MVDIMQPDSHIIDIQYIVSEKSRIASHRQTETQPFFPLVMCVKKGYEPVCMGQIHKSQNPLKMIARNFNEKFVAKVNNHEHLQEISTG